MRASQLHITGNLSAEHVSHTDARLLFGAGRDTRTGLMYVQEKSGTQRLETGDKEEHGGTPYLECCVFWRTWSVLVQRDLLFFHTDHHLNKDTE